MTDRIFQPPCPHCGAAQAERVKTPVIHEDVMLRRHRCSSCRRVFTTAQVSLTPEMADRFMEVVPDDAHA